MLRVAIVGLGNISSAHLPAWKTIKNAKITAVCDCREELLSKVPDAHGYTEYLDMLQQEELDIIDLCVPTYLHTIFAYTAMERGIHVICEKPASLAKQDVEMLYNTAKKNNVRFMVAQCLRFWPEYMELKNICDTKRYGALMAGIMERVGRIPTKSWNGWMQDESRSGGVMFDLHIHDLDFLVYTFGVPTKINTRRCKRPGQDYLHATYTYPGFSVATEAAWYAAPYPFHMSFRFQFEDAIVAYEGGKLTVYENNGNIFQPLEHAADGNYGADNLPQSDGYANEIRYFVNCVITGETPDRVKPEELTAVLDIVSEIK